MDDIALVIDADRNWEFMEVLIGRRNPANCPPYPLELEPEVKALLKEKRNRAN